MDYTQYQQESSKDNNTSHDQMTVVIRYYIFTEIMIDFCIKKDYAAIGKFSFPIATWPFFFCNYSIVSFYKRRGFS